MFHIAVTSGVSLARTFTEYKLRTTEMTLVRKPCESREKAFIPLRYAVFTLVAAVSGDTA